MNISFREACFIKKLPNMEGSFGYLATHKTLPNGTVIKVINNLTKEKESTIRELLGEKKIEGSGYPIDEYSVDNKLQGFIMPYYSHSHTFDYIVNRDMFTHYELTLNGKMLRPNYNTDKLKQALTNLSIIYGINFEKVINDRTTDVNSLFSLFKDNKEIYSYLSCDSSKPYFDVLIDTLEDEEKVIFESAKIYRKTNSLV